MADLKVTKMVMKVDLQCSNCYRKIKKVLCRYPREHPLDEIRDQVYDEKQNTVNIRVVCCSPEKIMEKIACKAGDTVESIEILPDKPKKNKEAAPGPPTKAPEPVPIPPPELPVPVVQRFPQPPPPVPVLMYPVGVCCCCYKGGPCFHGRGPMCYDGCGQPAYECSRGNRGYYVSRCDEYFSEENASGCSVM